MRAGIWVGAVSIVAGAVFAGAFGGGSPVVVLVVAGALILGLIAEHVAARRVPPPRASVAAAAEQPQRAARPYAAQDREDAVALLGIVDATTINWLATEEFATTWRDDKVAPLRA